LIFSAWLMTFAKWFPIPGIDGKFDFATMIRALVDYALMLVFSFYGAAMGGVTNHRIFVVATLDEDLWNKMI